ncbi:hypothetical protein ACFYUV_34330 [Nonomuraea sp. NPDC003560]
MELRDIEIFLTLAEEPHFGRTAAEQAVTTPSAGTGRVGALLGTMG